MKRKHLIIPFIILTLTIVGLYSACDHAKIASAEATTKPAYSSFQAVARFNRSASLVLTNTFQKIIWNGTSTLNGNTFPLDPAGSGLPIVNYNTSTNILNFYNPYTVNYVVYFTGETTATLLTTPVDLLWRVTIPNYYGAGQDLHYPNPNPDGIGYSDLGPVTYISARPFDVFFPITIDNPTKLNGAYIEVALSNTSLGTVTLTKCVLRISQTNSTN